MGSESKGGTSFLAKISKVVLAILILIALALGYFLYEKVVNKRVFTPEYADETIPDVETVHTHSSSKSAQQHSDADREVLVIPSGEASSDVVEAHSMLVAEHAVETSELTIGSGCEMSPMVLKTTLDSDITFKNSDSESHIITFSETRSFFVAANQSVTVPADFGEGTGTYGYTCDQDAAVVGVVSIIE